MSDFWESKRVFVTGATGLVGSWLIKSLVEKRAYTVALVRDCDPQSEFVRSGAIRKTSVVNGRLEDYYDIERAINEHEIDTVFHLGAQTIVGTANRSPLPTYEANIRGTYNLLEACRRLGDLVKRVLVASSDKAYGDSEVLPYTEDMPPLGRHPYDVSKSCTDLIAQAYYHTYELPVVIARCGNIYGGGDLNWSRIVPGTVRSLYHGQQPIIRSDGKFIRDYVYVKDAVNAYLAMAEGLDCSDLRGESFNFGPEQPCSVLEITDAIRRLMRREDLEPVILDQAKAEIRDQYLSSKKAESMLGWAPSFTLEEGLRQTIAWYEEYFSREQ
ncbi:MAG: GDP-mannose 4,6-dehydratase [Armatimonadota bacterium]